MKKWLKKLKRLIDSKNLTPAGNRRNVGIILFPLLLSFSFFLQWDLSTLSEWVK